MSGPAWQSLAENKIPCHLNIYQRREEEVTQAQREKSRQAGREGNPL